MASKVVYIADLEDPLEEVRMRPDFLAEYYRFGRLVAIFRPTPSQYRKIIKKTGRLRIFSNQIVRIFKRD